MNSKRVKKFFRLFGIIIFLFLIYNSDYNLIVSSLSSVKLNFIFYSLIFTPIFFSVKIFRWYYLLNKIGIDYSFSNSIVTFGAGLYAGQVTPGQVGELTRGVFLGNRGYNYSLSIQSVIVDRILDLICLFLFAVPGLVLFSNIKLETIIFIMFLTILITIIFILVIKKLHSRKSFKIISLTKELFLKFLESLNMLLQSLINYKVGFLLILLTLLALILNLIRFYFIALALDLEIEILYFIFGTIFAMAVGILPISILGIGTREAAYILVFNSLGLSNELAIAYSLLILIICYLFNIIWGFPAWLMETK